MLDISRTEHLVCSEGAKNYPGIKINKEAKEALATAMRSVVGEYFNQQLTGELIADIGKKLADEVEIFFKR